MYKLFMALRYLRAHRIIYFSIAGVAVGVLVMVIVTSVMGGFSRDIRARIRGMQADLTLTTITPDLYLPEYGKLVEEIQKIPHVKGVAPRLEHSAWMGLRGSRIVVQLTGIVPELEEGTSQIGEYFRRGNKRRFDFRREDGNEPAHPGVVLGVDRYWRDVTGMLSVRDDTPPRFLRGDFESVGFFKSGMSEYDAGVSANHAGLAFVSLEAMQKFMDVKAANIVAITLDDYEANVEEVRARILERMHRSRACFDPSNHARGWCGKYRTLSWEQAKSNLLQAVAIEKGIQIIILFCIVVVAGFNIIAIYTLMVRAKTRDIGILRALGAGEGGITSVFLISGTVSGLVGCVVGILAGLFLSVNINEITDFIELQSVHLNLMSHLPESERGEPVPGSGSFDNDGRLTLTSNVKSRANVGLSLALLLAAGGLLLYGWIRFYGEWRIGHWFPAALSSAFLCGGCWFFFDWMRVGDNAEAWSGVRTGILAGAAAFPLILAGVQRLLSKRPEGALRFVVSFASTAVWGVLFLALFGSVAMCTAILVNDPPLHWVGLNLFPKDVYYLDRIPVFVDMRTIAFLVGLTLVVSLIFSIYPARRAAKLDPIEAIREE